MVLNQIINSLLETDMYKFSMGRQFTTSFPITKRHGRLSAGTKMCILHRRWCRRLKSRLRHTAVCVLRRKSWTI